MHVLKAVPLGKGGRGNKGGLAEYAEAIGKSKQQIGQLRDAAEVVTANSMVDHTVLLDRAAHLYAIHALPAACWPVMVAALVKQGWSAERLEMDQATFSRWMKDFMQIGSLAKTHKSAAEHATDFDPPKPLANFASDCQNAGVENWATRPMRLRTIRWFLKRATTL